MFHHDQNFLYLNNVIGITSSINEILTKRPNADEAKYFKLLYSKNAAKYPYLILKQVSVLVSRYYLIIEAIFKCVTRYIMYKAIFQ